MRCWAASILLFFCCLLVACSTPAPTWRSKVATMVDELGSHGAPVLFPQAFNNLVETFEHGEAILHVQHDDREADTYYLMAFQKGELLRTEIKRHNELMAEQQRQKVAAQVAREEERLIRKAAEAEARLREQERLEAEEAFRAAAEKKMSNLKESSSPQTPTYTVRRGETLPQIAARSEIYNDSSLWPIIYRANRDQIRNPKQLWPGQVLKIPRHFSRDEAMDAKRYSGRK